MCRVPFPLSKSFKSEPQSVCFTLIDVRVLGIKRTKAREQDIPGNDAASGVLIPSQVIEYIAK